MYTSLALLAALTSLACISASALPFPPSLLSARAGGPAITPIPPNCTINYLSPPWPAYQPSAEVIKAAQLYPMYYAPVNKTSAAHSCMEQCYGYGDHTQCKAAFYADNIEIPKGYYGSPGGQFSAGCLLFKREFGAGDFVAAPAGQAVGAVAGNICCSG